MKKELSNNQANNIQNETPKNSVISQLTSGVGIVVIIIMAIFIGGIFFISYLLRVEDKPTDIQNYNASQGLTNSSTNSATYEETKNKDKDSLNNMLRMLNNWRLIDISSTMTIIAETSRFKNISDEIKTFQRAYAADNEFKPILDKIHAQLIKNQIAFFPKLRNLYASVANKLMNKENIHIYISGAQNSIIEFVGEQYAAETNVKVAYDILSTQLDALRFKRVIFRASKDSEYAKQISINSPDDKEIPN